MPSRRPAALEVSNGSSWSGERIGDAFVRGTWHRLPSWPVVRRRTVATARRTHVDRAGATQRDLQQTSTRNEERLTEHSRGGAAIGAALAESLAHGGDDELTQRIKGD